MKKLWIALALAAVLGAGRPAGADTRNGYFVSDLDVRDNSFGFHVFGTDLYSRGFSWDNDNTGNPVWGLNLLRTGGASDGALYLKPDGSGLTAVLEMRHDGGEMWLGQGVSQPGTGVQLQVTGGNSGTPRDGLYVNCFGDYNGLFLGQGNTSTLRTKINFQNNFQVGTDSSGMMTTDWYLKDTYQGKSTFPMIVGQDDKVVMTYGATVNGLASLAGGATISGTTTVNGPASLLGTTTTIGGTSSQVGFFGGTPQGKFTLTGCRSDGTALANLIQKLQAMGLLTDQTTP